MRYWWQGLPATSLDIPTGASGTFRYWIAGQAYVYLGSPPVQQSMFGRGQSAGRGKLAGGIYPARLKAQGLAGSRGKGLVRGNIILAGKGKGQSAGKLGIAGAGFILRILGKGRAGTEGRLGARLLGGLFARGGASATGRLQFGGRVSLKGKGRAQVAGKGVLKFLLPLFGRGKAQGSGRLFAQPFLSRVITYTSFFWRRDL